NDLEITINEFIVNSSLADVLDDHLSQVYHNITHLIDKVCIIYSFAKISKFFFILIFFSFTKCVNYFAAQGV
ncbi:MAG: hypothetical protein ACYTXY_53395, partial [Nostoc sp.]